MADVLVRGMEMPRGCFECILSFMWFNGTEAVLQCNVLEKLVSDDGSKDPDCPLIELPQHGDLIDRDALWEHVEDLACNTWVTASGVPVEALEKAPTVIEATKTEGGEK